MNKKINTIINVGLLFLLPLFILIAFETVYRGGDLSSTKYWVTYHTNQFFVNYVLMFGIVNTFYFLRRKAYLGVNLALLIFFSLISFVSYIKVTLRGEPLLPWDIFLGNEATNIATHFDNFVTTKLLVGSLVGVAILVAGIIFFPKQDEKERSKMTSIAASILAFSLFFSFYMEYVPLGKNFDIRLLNWDQKWNYDENGILLGFALNTKSLFIDEPKGYDENTITAMVNDSEGNKDIDKDFKPNIIFIMSEAFWDPTVLSEVEFSEDPIPFFHSLQKSETSGQMYSPVYGGGTVNTEFEALTSFSTQLLPKGMMPYIQYVHKPMNSLPQILSLQGYEATGVHPYEGWFYRRNKVYEYLGFDRFISGEFFRNPTHVGEFISDMDFTNRILKEVKTTKKPDFVYGVSMQAHGPYPLDKNPQNTIKVSGDLTQEAKNILETYSQTVSDVDDSLKALVQGLEESGEPSIVVFYGDHLPMLGQDYQVYKEANYFVDGRSYEEYKKMFSVPYVIWDNFSDKREDMNLSANFLAPYVLDLAKKEGSPMTDFLYDLLQDGESNLVRTDQRENENISQESINKINLLQYDLLLGKEYAYTDYPHPQIKENYQQGRFEPIIEGTNPPSIKAGEIFNDYNGKSVIGVHGENFIEGSFIYLNGEKLPTDYHDESYVTAIVPSNLYDAPGTLEVQVKGIDGMRNILNESNILNVEIIK